VRTFLDPLRGKFYTTHLAQYSKMDVAGGTNTLKYISFMMKLMLWNLFSLVNLDALTRWWEWQKWSWKENPMY